MYKYTHTCICMYIYGKFDNGPIEICKQIHTGCAPDALRCLWVQVCKPNVTSNMHWMFFALQGRLVGPTTDIPPGLQAMPPKGVRRDVITKDGDQPRPIEVCEVKAIRGGMCKKLMLLPIKLIAGECYAHVSTQSEWLNKVVGGGSRGVLSCNKSVTELLDEIKEAKMKALKSVAGAEAVATEDVIETSVSGRAALGLSDSEVEDSPSLELETPVKAPRRQRRITKASALDVEVRGRQLTVLNNMRENWVLEALLADAVAMFMEAHAVVVAKPLKPAADNVEGEDKGRVAYLFGEGCFQVSYMDATGKRCSTKKGFKVPSVDLQNEPLSREEWQLQLRRVRELTRKSWNELDKSDKPRF